MIRFMVIQYQHNIYDEWVDIVSSDIDDIKEAENIRSQYLDAYPQILPENVHVVQYKE